MQSKVVGRLEIWLKAARAQFCTATVTSGILGTVIAWHGSNKFNWVYFFLTILGIILINVGVNFVNDYFDHTSGLDEENKSPTKFSGGSRVIQDGLISARNILIVGLISLSLAALIGLYLNSKTLGNVILAIGIIGIFLGYFYTAEPLRLGYTLLGEIITGFCCGPLIVVGSYYVQAQKLSLKPFLASVPMGILVAMILFINEFPDYDADKRVDKRTLVVVLGKDRAIKLYYVFLFLIYPAIIIGVGFGLFPSFALITLLTAPLYVEAIKIARKNFNKIYELLPANAATVKLHLSFGLLLSVAYILDNLV